MEFYHSKIFENLRNPTTFEQLISHIQEPIPGTRGIVRIWRGQGDSSWPIHSSAYRRLALNGSIPKEKDVRSYEEYLLERATHRGFHKMDGYELNDFELLARLQHHGAATRLVDATSNALIGLFFAANTHPRKPGLLLGLHTEFIGGDKYSPEQRGYNVILKGLEGKCEGFELRTHPQIWEPPGVSPRIAAQHSRFLYSLVSQQKTGSLWFSESVESYMAIVISPAMKVKCLEILWKLFDIRWETLFPDLDGFGAANSPERDQYASDRW